MSERVPLVGVFVGGTSRRLGGVAKGLLPHPTERTTLVQRSVQLAHAMGAEAVLVGESAPYAKLGLPSIADWMTGLGPIGGLASLVQAAGERVVIALACDMPFVTSELLSKLLGTERGGAAVVVPVRSTGIEPLCALYDPEVLRPALVDALRSKRFGMRELVMRVQRVEVPLTGEQERWLDDWDAPEDML
jgi:molybdopterin-guanine dinucleotide biosynthesis protein A